MGSHCYPNGYLATNELPVPNFPGGGVSIKIPTGGLGSSNVRGVVVYMHGLATLGVPFPYLPVDVTGVLPVYAGTFTNALQADGWIVVTPTFAEDGVTPTAHSGVYNLLTSDSTHGTLYTAMLGRWWDHCVAWVQLTFGSLPIVPFGFSWGATLACRVAAAKTSTIAAFGAHAPAFQVAQCPTAYTPPVDFSQSPVVSTTTTGVQTLPTATINITSNTGLAANGYVRITTSAGQQIVYYTGSTGTTLTGCTGGTGNTSNGGTVTQSTFTSGLDLTTTFLNGVTSIPGIIGYGSADNAVGYSGQATMYTNAHAINSTITNNSTAEAHQFSSTDSTTYVSWFTGTVDPLCPKKY